MKVADLWKFMQECPNRGKILINREAISPYGDQWQDIPVTALKCEVRPEDVMKDMTKEDVQDLANRLNNDSVMP